MEGEQPEEEEEVEAEELEEEETGAAEEEEGEPRKGVEVLKLYPHSSQNCSPLYGCPQGQSGFALAGPEALEALDAVGFTMAGVGLGMMEGTAVEMMPC